jgi:hypothetical protein
MRTAVNWGCTRVNCNPDYPLIGNATGGFTTETIPETTAGRGTCAYPIEHT